METVEMPASKMKTAIAQIMLREGFIKGCEVVEEGVQGTLKLKLKYGSNGEKTISGLKKISKPGLRVYCRKDQIPKVLNGLGIAIISTSKGIVTDAEARELNVGGEVIAYIW
jgi:small subunit ribosomal protein S8